jgi:hypothetical protein
VETTPGGEYQPPQPYPQPQWGAPSPPPSWGAPPQPYAFAPQPVPNPYAQSHRYAPAAPSHRRRDALVVALVLLLIVVAAVVEMTTQSRLSRSNTSLAKGASTRTGPLFPAAPAPAIPSTAPPTATPSGQATDPPAVGGVTATSALTPTGGVKLFSDDFTDPASGWDVESLDLGSYAYGPSGYVIGTHTLVHLLALSPYYLSAQQIGLSITAHESVGAPQTGGFGLLCNRGGDSVTQLRYEFVVNESGRWFIERNQGELSSTPGRSAVILKEGTVLRPLGSQPLTMFGVCATLPDGRTTRLALFLDGTQVADITDVAALDGQGWISGLLSVGGAGVPATTTVSTFSETSLGTDIPSGGVPVPRASSPQFGVNA